eukprot:1161279-Pelagomonas_calceolata.AAC.11
MAHPITHVFYAYVKPSELKAWTLSNNEALYHLEGNAFLTSVQRHVVNPQAKQSKRRREACPLSSQNSTNTFPPASMRCVSAAAGTACQQTLLVSSSRHCVLAAAGTACQQTLLASSSRHGVSAAADIARQQTLLVSSSRHCALAATGTARKQQQALRGSRQGPLGGDNCKAWRHGWPT